MRWEMKMYLRIDDKPQRSSCYSVGDVECQLVLASRIEYPTTSTKLLATDAGCLVYYSPCRGIGRKICRMESKSMTAVIHVTAKRTIGITRQ